MVQNLSETYQWLVEEMGLPFNALTQKELVALDQFFQEYNKAMEAIKQYEVVTKTSRLCSNLS